MNFAGGRHSSYQYGWVHLAKSDMDVAWMDETCWTSFQGTD